ncbi:Rab geranylgeranyltransferase BET2 PWA37_004484 [Arxiozyma heterogenica]|uniref:Rab geranylgeranyltransferase BET2 n=1 Tax=Arxiozyma heterogenica TaxID=278026 RepID=UPI002F12D98C
MVNALLKEKHIKYLKSLDSQKETLEYWLSEHLRLNGIYWGLTALCILDSKETFQREEVIQFVMSCWNNRTGGFGPFPKHDAHMLSTLSGLQILLTYDAINLITEDSEKLDSVVQFIKGNQLPDGSFQGDRFGEVDARFSYNALSALSILGMLSPEVVDPAVEHILKCLNFDGGFGLCPGAESHASMAFTCLGALSIVNKLNLLTPEQIDTIAWWLCERQVPEGGLNGRPSKLPDVCYSFWVVSSLAIIDRLDWIDSDKLANFILESQDEIKGGIADRPGNEVDVFHTVFGLAGLSLIGYDNLVEIDPTYCMTYEVTSKIHKYPY